MTKEVNIFELASREKLRFNTGRLQVTVEQLWELPLTGANSLDTLAVELDAAIRNTAPRSFVTNSATAADKTLQLQFDIVKHVIDIRVAERKAKAEKAEKASQRKLLREAIAAKEHEELLSGDTEALKAKLAALEAEEE